MILTEVSVLSEKPPLLSIAKVVGVCHPFQIDFVKEVGDAVDLRLQFCYNSDKEKQIPAFLVAELLRK